MSNPESQFKSVCLNRDLVVKYPNQSFFLKERKGKPSVQGWLSSAVTLFYYPPSRVFEVLNFSDTPHEGPSLRNHYFLVLP